VDVERAADLYAQGWTLRQIGAELGLTGTTVSNQLRRAGVTMRRGAHGHDASTDQILQLRGQGISWTEVAEQVGMTRSGAWSRYRRARPPNPNAWAVGSRYLPTPLTRTLRLASVRQWLIILVVPPLGLSSPPRGEPPTVLSPSVVPACCMYGALMPTLRQVIAPI
jgi:hypothetical protein